MNYQVFPLIFMRITTLLFFFIAVGLNFLGVSALICYFVLVGVAFPIAISMRLHRLNESGLALTLTENSQWIIYIHGFPAQEQRSVLKNPCFFSQARLRQFFIISFSCKLCLQVACIGILVCDYNHDGNVAGVLFVLICLLAFAGRSLYWLSGIIGNKWQYETLTTDTGSVWYQGFSPKGEGRETLFSRLI
ncbi:hypothetical protein [Citrobacter portucalensis]|uniref:Uncharacterized protein n=1 Tax=Citrobacter portucalensis TaxID=1639133 RepID=A0A9X4GH85_9ENTR|nr:hypothetical protein [Citrobacter portucalensis]MDE9617019.1 hypothetical protein [Citrobacter portucalensis]